MNEATDKGRKISTGWAKSIQEFRIHTVVCRKSTGLYDVTVHVNEGRESLFGLFDNEARSSRQVRIFSGLETRQEAIRVAQFARNQLFSMVAAQIAEWRDAVV